MLLYPLELILGGKETAIEIQNGKFSWEDETDDMNSDHTKPSTSPTGDTEEITGERSKTLQLTDITLNIKKVIIVYIKRHPHLIIGRRISRLLVKFRSFNSNLQ